VEDILLQLLPAEELTKLSNLVPKGEIPLWKYWEEFVTKYLRLGKSRSTVQNVRDTLKVVILRLKFLTIEDCLNTEKLEDALHGYKERRGIKATTFNSYLKNLKTYFIWLERYDRVKENRIRRIPKCTEAYREKLVLDEEKVGKIVAHLSTRRQTRLQRARNIFLVDLLRFTGARPCEIAALKTTNITPTKDTYTLVIHGAKQKGKNRYYLLKGYVRDSYERYIKIRNKLRPDEKHLFISSSKRTGWGQKGIRYLFKKLNQDLGFKVTAYAFRRYVATKLYRKGMSLEGIGDYLGHTRTSTTRRYLEDICAWTDESGDIMAEE
jgi:site-specific recombinase XerD